MNIIINDISHRLVKTEDTEGYIEYDVYRADSLIGHITKSGSEIHYTARDAEKNIKGIGSTLRETLEKMVLNMFYSQSFKGDRFINTLGAWIEGSKIQVEYTKNDVVKYAERVVRYSKQSGDLYIVIDNRKYFYCEFN